MTRFFWIVCAGVINHASPYRPGDCTRKPQFDHAKFDSSCHQLAALDVISWWLWLWSFLVLVGLLVDWFSRRGDSERKRTVFGA